jgi:hypothetical protein
MTTNIYIFKGIFYTLVYNLTKQLDKKRERVYTIARKLQKVR